MFATIVEDAIIELRILGENNFQYLRKMFCTADT